MQPAAVDAHKQVVENPLNDLSKGQGHDGQVVPLQPQDRDANEEAHQSGKQGAHNHTDNQTDRPGGDVVPQRHRCGDAGEGPHTHKSRMAQGEFSQHTHCQVQGNGHDHVGANGHQHSLHGGGEAACAAENLHHQKGKNHDGIGHIIVAGGFVQTQCSFHGCHLKLSLGSACPADRPV